MSKPYLYLVSRNSIIAALLLTIILYFLQGIIRPKPDYNWDSIPYMNLVLKYDGVENDSIRHAETYKTLHAQVPEEEWKKLAETDHWYRLRNYQSWEVGTETLPFYSIKPLYIVNCWVFYKMGFDLYDSTWIPNFFCYFFIALAFFIYIDSKKNYWIAFFATLFIMLTPFFLELSILSTPDALGTLIFMAITILYLEKRSMWIILGASIAAILIRPDHLVICGLLFGLLALEKNNWMDRIKTALIPSVILLTVHFLNYKLNGNPGWKVLFMHSFQGNIHHPVSGIENRVWEWSEFIKTHKNHIHSISFLLWLLLIPTLLMLPKKIRIPELLKRRDFLLFVAIVVATLIKFVLFPYTIDRYFAPFYAAGILLMIYRIGRNSDNSKTETYG